MGKIRAFLKSDGIRNRVANFTLIMLLCLITGYVAVFYVTIQLSNNISEMFRQSLVLESVTESLDDFQSNLESYLNTKDSDAFVAYLQNYNHLSSLRQELGGRLSWREEQLLGSNIGNILDAILESASRAIDSKRGRNTPSYIEAFNEVQRYSGYVNADINRIREMEFSGNLQDYLLLSKRIENLKGVFIAMTGVIVALSMVFIYDFTRRLTDPIEKLSHYAGEISKGNYSVELSSVGAYREADLLTKTLTDMAKSIKNYIGELQDKADMENLLRLSEIENLKNKNLLKNAEYTALQSQINPHFLFNTLNAGTQLANLEDAEKTGEFMENLAAMFRYNIQSLDNKVSLSDEIDNVQNYCHLMKVRFDDMIRFEFDVENPSDVVKMPPLILQPLVENGFIHGFKNMEEPGVISIQVRQFSDHVRVLIRDNGHGIPKEKVRLLNETGFRVDDNGSDHTGHTTGLGLGNVYERLRYFYDRDDVLSVRSVENQFTEMQVKLYLKSEELNG